MCGLPLRSYVGVGISSDPLGTDTLMRFTLAEPLFHYHRTWALNCAPNEDRIMSKFVTHERDRLDHEKNQIYVIVCAYVQPIPTPTPP